MMDSMDDVRKFLDKPKKYHPLPNGKFTDGFGNMLDAHSVVYELTAERDRLAAENAELKKELVIWKESQQQTVLDYEQVLADLEATDATLDALRQAVRKWADQQASFERQYNTDPNVALHGLLLSITAILDPQDPQPAALANDAADVRD